MATTPPTASDPPADAESPAPAKKNFFAKLNIVLFLLAVIIAECLAAYYYLPSSAAGNVAAVKPADNAEPTEAAKADAAKSLDLPSESQGGAESAQRIEVSLGEYCVTCFQPASNSTLRIDFRLYGTVDQVDEKEFTKQFEDSKHRFREQVLVIVRSADIADVTDAGLGLIKRKILDSANKTFGKALLKSIIFSDFSFIEQ